MFSVRTIIPFFFRVVEPFYMSAAYKCGYLGSMLSQWQVVCEISLYVSYSVVCEILHLDFRMFMIFFGLNLEFSCLFLCLVICMTLVITLLYLRINTYDNPVSISVVQLSLSSVGYLVIFY